MKTITYELGGKIRSVMVPPESAAWIQHTDYTQGKSDIIIRMKKADEQNALVSFNNAKRENPSPCWRAVSATGYLETTGGVAPDSNPYYRISFVFKNNDWNMLVTENMQEFKQAQRDTLALGAPLPSSAQVGQPEVKQVLELLGKASAGGRWG